MSYNPAQTIFVGAPNPPQTQQPVSPTQQPFTPAQQPYSPTQQPFSPIPQGQQGPPLPNQFMDPNQAAAPAPIFFKIIDVVTEWQRGNFLPALHCLRYNLIPKDYLDTTGYNVIHHAVSQGSVPITLILLDYFKIDVNIKSGNNQTPLMIACNYGLIDIIRILVERGAFINEQDDTRFSGLLYTIKQGRIPQFAYLLHQKADLQVRDANGCTGVHWAAYKNNVFLLKILHRLGLDLNSLDFTGLTPLDRAAQSGAFEATKFFLEFGDGKKPPNMKFDQIVSADVKELLRKKYFPTKKEKFIEQTTETFKKHVKSLTVGAYSLLWLVMMGMFLTIVMNQQGTFDLVFFLLSLFSFSFSLFYYLKSHGTGSKTKVFAYESLHVSSDLNDSLNVSIAKAHPASKINFEVLDKFVKGENKNSFHHEGESDGYPSFLHELAALFEMKNYKELARFNEKDNCPVCLIRRPHRSGHCEELNTCVSNFQHYSNPLKAAITDKDHYLYMALLTLQQIVLGVFILSLWINYADKITQKKVLVLDVGRLIWNDYGFLYTAGYAIFIVLALYNTVFFLIEVYGVLKNETYYEIFDRANCTYMFRVKQDKRGGFVKSFKNPYDHGKWNNLKQYVGKIFHFDMGGQK